MTSSAQPLATIMRIVGMIVMVLMLGIGLSNIITGAAPLLPTVDRSNTTLANGDGTLIAGYRAAPSTAGDTRLAFIVPDRWSITESTTNLAGQLHQAGYGAYVADPWRAPAPTTLVQAWRNVIYAHHNSYAVPFDVSTQWQQAQAQQVATMQQAVIVGMCDGASYAVQVAATSNAPRTSVLLYGTLPTIAREGMQEHAPEAAFTLNVVLVTATAPTEAQQHAFTNLLAARGIISTLIVVSEPTFACGTTAPTTLPSSQSASWQQVQSVLP